MNIRSTLLITAATFLVSAAAVADSLDMSAVTCEKFLQTTSSRTLPFVVGWLMGHHAGKDVRPILDFEKADQASAQLLKICGDNPSISVTAAGERLE